MLRFEAGGGAGVYVEASGGLLLKEVFDEFGACLASCPEDGVRRRDRARTLSVREMELLSPMFPNGAMGFIQRNGC